MKSKPIHETGLPLDNVNSSQAQLTLLPSISDQISNIPKTRYYGSKRKLLYWLYDTVKGLEFETVLDVFGGTASVSRMFQDMKKRVTYNDAFFFNQDVARAILSDTISIDRIDFQSIIESTQPRNGFIASTYPDMYYTDSENRWLDGFMFLLASANFDPNLCSIFRFALYQACLKKRPFNLFHRANLNLRTRKGVKRSFGNFTTWEKPFTEHMLDAYDELVRVEKRYVKPAQILAPQSAEYLPNNFDLVYIDPPYVSLSNKNNRDEYWRKYHFLEGLATYQTWAECALENNNIKSLPQPNYFAEWSSKKTFKEKLFSLIQKHKNSIVVLSYVTDAHPSESEISDYFNTTFTATSVHSRDYNHALSKKKKREILFVGRP